MGSNFDWYVGYVVGFLKTTSVQNGRIEALECLRGFAAVYVVAGHVCNVYFHNPKWALPFRFAAEAVVLFFLLSGFVVRFSTPEKTTFSDFFVRRIKRIYPLFLLSLAFSYLMASLTAGQWLPLLPVSIVGNLLMLQDFGYARPGVWVNQYYNEALWSLAYEWWFYVVFILLVKSGLSPFGKNVSVVLMTLMAMALHSLQPSPVGYFLVNFSIWWSASEIARHVMAGANLTIRLVLPWVAFLFVVGLSWLWYLFEMPRSEWSPGLYPILDMRRYFAGALFLTVGLVWYKLWAVGGERLFYGIFGIFKIFAPISYAIYIFHFPILNFFVNSELAAYPVLCVLSILVAVLVVAFVADNWVQKWVNGLSIWGKWRSQGSLSQHSTVAVQPKIQSAL